MMRAALQRRVMAVMPRAPRAAAATPCASEACGIARHDFAKIAVMHQMHHGTAMGTTHCEGATGQMRMNVRTEDCAGNCTTLHEQSHVEYSRECCRRVRRCFDAAPDDEAAQRCQSAYLNWWSEKEYDDERRANIVTAACLRRTIDHACGSRTGTIAGAAIGGAVLGGALGLLGFLAGPLVGGITTGIGALVGGITGGLLGAHVGRATPECCERLRETLEDTEREIRENATLASTATPCPFREDGTIIPAPGAPAGGAR